MHEGSNEGMRLYVHAFSFLNDQAGEPSCYCIDEEDGDWLYITRHNGARNLIKANACMSY
jgi:hypothetical protein